MAGNLQKKGDLKSTWAARFVELRGPWMSFWATSAKKHKKGEIHIGGCKCIKDPKGGDKCVSLVMPGQHQHVHTFRVLPPSKAAGSTEETAQADFELWYDSFLNAGIHEAIAAGGVVDVSMLQDVEREEDKIDGGKVDADMLSWCLVFRIDHSSSGAVPVEALEVARNLTAAKLHVEDRE